VFQTATGVVANVSHTVLNMKAWINPQQLAAADDRYTAITSALTAATLLHFDINTGCGTLVLGAAL
jgi:hypothetical protein